MKLSGQETPQQFRGDFIPCVALQFPQSLITTGLLIAPPDATASIALTTSIPSTTLPKMTCLPSR